MCVIFCFNNLQAEVWSIPVLVSLNFSISLSLYSIDLFYFLLNLGTMTTRMTQYQSVTARHLTVLRMLYLLVLILTLLMENTLSMPSVIDYMVALIARYLVYNT